MNDAMKSGFEGLTNSEKGNEVHSFTELQEWITERKRTQGVSIGRIELSECSPWYYDEEEGIIRNTKRSFFQIAGIRCKYQNQETVDQPIILQKEIGFLGIICKKINGTWHFLMQAKIEPGNINYVQISPTIQATKSNFSRQHGGREPAYLHFFTNMNLDDVLVDQIQSEQSSRFYGKRNRNVIIKTEAEIEETDSHKWMTFRQLRQFMAVDNAINMDTRTVLSCIPYVFMPDAHLGHEEAFKRSLRTIDRKTVIDLYSLINDYKMFLAPQISFVPLKQLKDWKFEKSELIHKEEYPFKVVFCDLEIEGREVTNWKQPLFEALGEATFGLICSVSSGMLEVLVRVQPEIGCFDSVEIGPTVQEEYASKKKRDSVADLFYQNIDRKEKKLIDVVLSEEGGRFYHEQNRNVVMILDKAMVQYDRKKYVWAEVGTLNAMTQINNCLNIQLRNLLTLLYMFA